MVPGETGGNKLSDGSGEDALPAGLPRNTVMFASGTALQPAVLFLMNAMRHFAIRHYVSCLPACFLFALLCSYSHYYSASCYTIVVAEVALWMNGGGCCSNRTTYYTHFAGTGETTNNGVSGRKKDVGNMPYTCVSSRRASPFCGDGCWTLTLIHFLLRIFRHSTPSSSFICSLAVGGSSGIVVGQALRGCVCSFSHCCTAPVTLSLRLCGWLFYGILVPSLFLLNAASLVTNAPFRWSG